jgi:hypothetical protein
MLVNFNMIGKFLTKNGGLQLKQRRNIRGFTRQ